jgi:hypothetical protein
VPGIENVRPGTRSALAWFGAAAPPVAWAAQLLVGYSMQEAGCGRPDSNLWGAGLATLTAIVLAVCGVTAVAGGIASVAALRETGSNDPRGRVRFVAVSGIVASAVFGLAILLTAIPLFSLDPCRPG